MVDIPTIMTIRPAIIQVIPENQRNTGNIQVNIHALTKMTTIPLCQTTKTVVQQDHMLVDVVDIVEPLVRWLDRQVDRRSFVLQNFCESVRQLHLHAS